MLTYIQWGTKDFEFELNSAYDSGQEVKLYELNYALDSVNKAISSWIETHHGKEILNACTMGVFEVEAEHLVDLDQLCEFISSCSQMEFCFGVGVEAPHAKSACEYGLYHGDKISLYHDDMDLPEEEEEDPLAKAEHDETPVVSFLPKDILCSRESMMAAHDNNVFGKGSFSSGKPIELHQLEDGRHLLTDGHHRLAAHLLTGGAKTPINARIIGRGHTDYWTTPQKPFKHTETAFGGLESFVEKKTLANDLGRFKSRPLNKHDDDDQAGLNKAEHPDAHGQLAQQQEDPTEVIMAGIKLLKEHSAKIEELKHASPEIYDTIRHISQAMVAMAKQMSEIKQAANQESESIKKSEQLFKTDMSQEDGNKLGSHQGYANLAEQFNYLDHTNAKPIGNGFFHHTFEGAQGQIHSHTLSRSADPRKPHIAQLHMALQDDGIPSVESIAVHPDYKGHGYGKALYLGAIQHHGKIYSDTKMSPNAGKAWEHLATVANVTDGPDGRKMASLEKKLSFPEPLAGVGTGANGAVHKKKIKTAVRDQATGKKKPARWRSVRSGMVMSQSGGVASSRLPNVD